MNNVFSRPLFKNKFVQRFAEGGIVSTVTGPEEEDPMAILSNMAMQVDATEKNLDSAESIDDILTSFSGSPKSAQDARSELAEVVGQADADATPESVLALVQPTMAILEMSRQMSPPGGIASMPMEQPAPPPGMPVPGFAVGGEVDVNSIMQKYASMQNQIPANYGSDPSGAWLALAQLGAGMAQGKTFSEGLSMGTQMAGPYMQQALSDKAKRRDALSNFVAEESARREAAAVREQELKDTRAFDVQQLDKQLQAQKDLEALRTENDMALERLKSELSPDKLTDTQFILGDLEKKRALLSELPENDPMVPTLLQQIKDRETLLFSKEATDTRTPEIKNAQRMAELEAIVANDPTNLNAMTELAYLQSQVDNPEKKTDTRTPEQKNAARITELETVILNDPNNTEAKIELATLRSLLEKPESKTKLQSRNAVIWDKNAPNGFRTSVVNYDNSTGENFITNPDGTRKVLAPDEFIEGTADSVVNVTPDPVGNTVVTIKQGPRAGESYLSTFTTSDGQKISFNNPQGIGVDPGNPYAVEQPAPTVPIEKLNPQTRDDMATKLSGIEQSIRNVDSLLKTGLKTGPGATVEGWLTKMATLSPDALAKEMEFLKTEQGAAQWALVQREIVRARVLSPRFAVSEQEAVREFETQAGPQEFFTNPKAAAIRLGEILRSMKNDYEYLRGSLTNSPYREMQPPTLGTPDDPFDMSDEKDNAYFNYLKNDPQTRAGLNETVLFFPNFTGSLAPLSERFQKVQGAKGVGYYVTVGEMFGGQ